MFEDLYKKANGKIPTEDAYLRVMGRVDEGLHKNKYGYTKIAALAACFLLTVSAVSVYKNHSSQNENNFEIVISAGNAVQPSENQASETPAPVREKTIPAENKPIPRQTSPQQPIANNVTPRIVASPQTNIVKIQGLAEANKPMTARIIGRAYTQEEYTEYLGKNIEESVVLPDSFKNETQNEQSLCINTDEHLFDAENDEWTYSFSDGKSSVSIITTKNTDNIDRIIGCEEYEKSTILDSSAVVFEEGEQKQAFLIADEIGYTVNALGVSDEIYENLLISLVK